MKKTFITVLLLLILFAGLALILYPVVSDLWNRNHASYAVSVYNDTVSSLKQEDTTQVKAEIEAYNARMAERENLFELPERMEVEYNSLLDLSGNGIMGYLEIPLISVTLPIYHGTSETVLQIGVGHVEWSSLPAGGESTHCVLSGHRGLPSAKLFTNLDKLSEGDSFNLHILNETLVYQVERIQIVLPADVESLAIQAGEDLCTLVTCTPYGVNSHRLLVTGRRLEESGEEETVIKAPVHVTADAVLIDRNLVAVGVAGPLLLIAFLIVAIGSIRK